MKVLRGGSIQPTSSTSPPSIFFCFRKSPPQRQHSKVLTGGSITHLSSTPTSSTPRIFDVSKSHRAVSHIDFPRRNPYNPLRLRRIKVPLGSIGKSLRGSIMRSPLRRQHQNFRVFGAEKGKLGGVWGLFSGEFVLSCRSARSCWLWAQLVLVRIESHLLSSHCDFLVFNVRVILCRVS